MRGKDVGGAIVANQTSTGQRAAAIEGRGYVDGIMERRMSGESGGKVNTVQGIAGG